MAVEAWGLKNCTQKEEWFSDTVTAVMVPPYIDSGEVVRRAWKRYNLSLGLGLNKVAGKVFRIGHLGNMNEVNHFYPFHSCHIRSFIHHIILICHILNWFCYILVYFVIKHLMDTCQIITIVRESSVLIIRT